MADDLGLDLHQLFLQRGERLDFFIPDLNGADVLWDRNEAP
jgi:hypothetical protein